MSAYRLTHGSLFADILRLTPDRDRHVWVYIVQRQGSPDILGMGTCPTQKEARDLARRVMKDIAGEQDGEAAAAS